MFTGKQVSFYKHIKKKKSKTPFSSGTKSRRGKRQSKRQWPNIEQLLEKCAPCSSAQRWKPVKERTQQKMLPELNLRGQVGTGQMEKMERLFQKKGTIFTKKQRKNGVPS